MDALPSPYVYELRREGCVEATGTLLLEEQPQVGETIRIGRALTEVEDVVCLAGGVRIVLRSLAQ